MLTVLQANADFEALGETLRAMRATIETTDPAEAETKVNDLAKAFGSVAGAGDVRSALSKARRALKSRTPDQEKALKEYEKALAIYEEQVQWRAEAGKTLVPGITQYLDGIRESLGARMRPKLSRDQALYLASCSAGHRDLSLNF